MTIYYDYLWIKIKLDIKSRNTDLYLKYTHCQQKNLLKTRGIPEHLWHNLYFRNIWTEIPSQITTRHILI